MSRPRAAMSVATRIATRPRLKSSNARTRCDWLLLPWIAAAVMPSVVSCSARRLAPCLVRVKTSACVDPTRTDELAEQRALAVAVDLDDHLVHERSGGVLGRDLDHRRVDDEVGREALDLVGERGREQQVLARHGKQREDLAQVMDEAHVQHAVGLVEHEHLDPGQVDGPLRHMVEQPAGRGDDDLGALAQAPDLVVEPDATVDRGRADRALVAVDANALFDLERELASRDEHEHADRATDGRLAAVVYGRRRVVLVSRWRIGSTNAAVLPVPVWAPASTSRPASTCGIASRWTGVGSV